MQVENSLITEAPVFTPTMEEFHDFSKYVQSIEPLCKCGIARIIPPKEWNENFTYDNIDLVIPTPIKQFVSGQKGVYQLLLMEAPQITVTEFEELALKEKIPKSSKYDYDSVERTFWKNLRFNPPMYGADMSGSFFGEDVKYWNLNHLDSMLKVMADDMPGITTPYLYFGMWKAMFAWHVEDMNLFSINYLHFGEPKSWYCIPPEHGARFERLMQSYFPDKLKECPEFLRHKTSMVSPTLIVQNQIPIVKTVQEKGQFIITFPYAYHCGYNNGFNCAESVNFALPSWLEYGKKAKSCKCQSDTVKIDIETLEKGYKEYEEGLLDLKEVDEIKALHKAKKKSKSPRRMFNPTSKYETRKSISSRRLKLPPSPKEEVNDEEEEIDVIDIESLNSPKSKDEPDTDSNVSPKEVSDDEESVAQKDDQSSSTRKKRKITDEDTQILEEYYDKYNGVLEKGVKESIAKELNWTAQGVYHWFRRKKLRSDSPSKPTATQKKSIAQKPAPSPQKHRNPVSKKPLKQPGSSSQTSSIKTRSQH